MTRRPAFSPRAGLAAALSFACLAAGVPACAGASRSTPGSRPEARPPLRAPWVDSSTGARVVRVTGDRGETFEISGGRGVWGAVARHHYSRDQPWSADGAWLAIENRDGGDPGFVLLDGATYRPARTRCAAFRLSEFRWHPSRTHARLVIGVRGDSLVWFDPFECRVIRGWRLPFRPKGIGPGEGNASDDGRFLALAAGDSMVVVDMDPRPPLASYASGNRRIGPVQAIAPCRLDPANPARCPVGHVSVSSSGRFVDVKFAGAAGTETGDAHRIYAVDSTTLALRVQTMDAQARRCGAFAARRDGWIFPIKHADLARDPADGEDVIVGGRACPGSTLGRVVKVRLRDGAVTALTDPRGEASVAHVSTRNLDRLGWVYVTYNAAPGKRWSGEVVAVALDGSGRVERIAHHRSVWQGCYRCESHAVPSPDGRRVLFASNWAEGCPGCRGQVNAYVAEIPRPTR